MIRPQEWSRQRIFWTEQLQDSIFAKLITTKKRGAARLHVRTRLPFTIIRDVPSLTTLFNLQKCSSIRCGPLEFPQCMPCSWLRYRHSRCTDQKIGCAFLVKHSADSFQSFKVKNWLRTWRRINDINRERVHCEGRTLIEDMLWLPIRRKVAYACNDACNDADFSFNRMIPCKLLFDSDCVYFSRTEIRWSTKLHDCLDNLKPFWGGGEKWFSKHDSVKQLQLCLTFSVKFNVLHPFALNDTKLELSLCVSPKTCEVLRTSIRPNTAVVLILTCVFLDFAYLKIQLKHFRM